MPRRWGLCATAAERRPLCPRAGEPLLSVANSPGQYRQGAIYVRDDVTGDVYEGPQWQQVAGLMDAAAGAWHPERDTSLWLKFNLRAHHMQAQTVRPRVEVAAPLDDPRRRGHQGGLPPRTAHALLDAALGLRVRRPGYARLAEVEDRTASRDLRLLVGRGPLQALGQTRGRVYAAGEGLWAPAAHAQAQTAPLEDPYPELEPTITRVARAVSASAPPGGRLTTSS